MENLTEHGTMVRIKKSTVKKLWKIKVELNHKNFDETINYLITDSFEEV